MACDAWQKIGELTCDLDPGEIGAGHAVTALYEIVPASADEKRLKVSPAIEGLKYQSRKVAVPGLAWSANEPTPVSKDLLTVEVRFKQPILLPSTVTFGEADGRFAVHGHLEGTLT